jgi:hypothetical protein
LTTPAIELWADACNGSRRRTKTAVANVLRAIAPIRMKHLPTRAFIDEWPAE